MVLLFTEQAVFDFLTSRVKAFEIFSICVCRDFITGWMAVYGGWISGYTIWDAVIPTRIYPAQHYFLDITSRQ